MALRVIIDPRRASTLVVIPPRHAFVGAIAMTLFGACALAGAIDTYLGQPARYHVYALILLLLAGVSLPAGVLALFRRTRFVFDTVSGTLIVEHAGLLRARRTVRPLDALDAVLLVRYWLFNRLARAESDFWYRLQLRASGDDILELAPKLRQDEASDAAGAVAAHLAIPIVQVEGRAEGVVAGR